MYTTDERSAANYRQSRCVTFALFFSSSRELALELLDVSCLKLNSPNRAPVASLSVSARHTAADVLVPLIFNRYRTRLELTAFPKAGFCAAVGV